ncbi:DUF4296 domain-containing protein [Pontibacter litorisediminis]|uniref:DUF4296 domain-containing protein n=1 Tax=Pontibacter litorisediminis TaxID=1846260 RepID=UPI0023EE02B8|nr:DUF4296 domain-containing protein [Pontibacter litorisediminis]
MKRLFSILFCVSLLGCQSQSGEKPKDMIPQEEMVRILADIHTVEAMIESNVTYPDTAMMTYNKEQEKILEQHNVTPEQFKSTYNYYLENIGEMNKLYEVVVDTLSMRESKAQAREGRPQEIRPATGKEQLQAQ